MDSKQETLKFLVFGEKKSGKTALLNRIIGGTDPKSKPGTAYKAKSVDIEDNKVEFMLKDDSDIFSNISKFKEVIESANAIFLTVDMTQPDALTMAENRIGYIRGDNDSEPKTKPKPIILIGTKSDNVKKQKITEEKLKEFAKLHTKNSVFGPHITSAETGVGVDGDTLLKFARDVVIENDRNFMSKIADTSKSIKESKIADINKNIRGLILHDLKSYNSGFTSNNIKKSEIADINKNIKGLILRDLKSYTSGRNKFLAYLKAVLSLGVFRLGVKKQEKAEALKAKLNQSDADTEQLVKTYKEENEKLVSDEIKHSRLFVKPYMKKQPSGEGKLNEGELGNILNKPTSFKNE